MRLGEKEKGFILGWMGGKHHGLEVESVSGGIGGVSVFVVCSLCCGMDIG